MQIIGHSLQVLSLGHNAKRPCSREPLEPKLVISNKAKQQISQQVLQKLTKHAKFSEKQTFLTF